MPGAKPVMIARDDSRLLRSKAPKFVSASCPVARFHPPHAPKARPSIARVLPPAFDLPIAEKPKAKGTDVNLSRSLTNNALEGFLSSSAPTEVGMFLRNNIPGLEENLKSGKLGTSPTVFSLLRSLSLPNDQDAAALLNARAKKVEAAKQNPGATGIAGLDFNIDLNAGNAGAGKVVSEPFQLEGVEEGGFSLGGDEEQRGYVEEPEEGYVEEEEGYEGDEGDYGEGDEEYYEEGQEEEPKESQLGGLY